MLHLRQQWQKFGFPDMLKHWCSYFCLQGKNLNFVTDCMEPGKTPDDGREIKSAFVSKLSIQLSNEKKSASQHHIQNNPQRTAMSPLTVIISLTNKSMKDEVFEANANIRNAVGNFQTLNSLQRQKSKRIKYIFKVHRN